VDQASIESIEAKDRVKIGDSLLVLKLVFVVTDFDVNFQIQSINEGAIGGLTPVVKEGVPHSEDKRENLYKSCMSFSLSYLS
jgi:hypothetical protein